MPEPQPGADRPAHGNPPGTGSDRDPAVAEQPDPSPAPPEAAATGPAAAPGVSIAAPADVPATSGPDDPIGLDGTRRLDETAPAEPTHGTLRPDEPTRSDGPAGTDPTESTAVDEPGAGRLDEIAPTGGGAPQPDGPAGTKPLPVGETPDPAPRWSGSAPVPPPPPRRRSWGESAEPTPPPMPESPEHRIPVDPWAGVDTGGWELPSAELPALPPTLSYPPAPPTRPYSGPPAPAPPPPVAHPVPPSVHPVSPPPSAPARQPAAGPPAPPPVAPPPQPVAPLAPQPVAPPKQRRSKRRPTPPPAAPPPGWRAPKGYVPVPVRKRRRWPWLLLLALACCCGCPAYYGMPIWSQYPAHAALPAQVADLSLRQDGRSTQAAQQLEAEVRKAHLLAEDTFAGVYANPDGKQVTVFGGTGFRFDPASAADDEIARLTEKYQLGSVETVDTGVRGRHQRCAVGRAEGDAVVVCTSVDHGSIASAVFTRLSLQDSAGLLDTLRGQIVSSDRN
ncbi:hypothetical protein [Micromonospora avicenniae]|uniref:hypothetical protein n=1 Tax=Micromonospora avicenniae TaxID=1198245 RepID=UPI003F57C8C2